MTHFRFRFKRTGYIRWRCRASRRRLVVIVVCPLGEVSRPRSEAARRRTAPLAVAIWVPTAATLRVGTFVVGENGDPQLHGHPNICY